MNSSEASYNTTEKQGTARILPVALMIASMLLAAVISMVACGEDAPQAVVDEHEKIVQDVHVHKRWQQRGVARLGEFIHVFAISFYAVAAPIDLMILLTYHLKHRRRIPRVSFCLMISSIGAILCLIGWLFAYSLCWIGVIAVAGAHAASIAVERAQVWSRSLS